MNVTRYMDLSLKPIPEHSPIPPNSVACLYGFYTVEGPAAGTKFVICKNRQELVIDGPPLKKVPGIENMNPKDRTILLERMFDEYLEIVEDLVSTIEFGLTGWAHLVPPTSADGYQIILDYERQLRRISCPTWAPIIPIDEVEFTVWGPDADRRGIWNGKEIDIFYAYDDLNMWRLNRAMYGLRHIDGLGFTFELYGHLADRDGQIIGMVSEAAWGRTLRPSDKELVFAEMKRLESFGCIYRGCWANHFLIADGKLRILQSIYISHYTDPEALKRDAAFFHTQLLEDLFQEFEIFGPFGNFRLLPKVLTDKYEPITYLRHPIPRSISTKSMVYLQNYPRFGFRAVVIHGDSDRDEDDHPQRLVSLRARRPQRDALRLLYRDPRQNNRSTQEEDTPLCSSSRLRHHVFVSVRRPYARPMSGRTSQVLHDGDTIESDADSIGDTCSPYQRRLICYD